MFIIFMDISRYIHRTIFFMQLRDPDSTKDEPIFLVIMNRFSIQVAIWKVLFYSDPLYFAENIASKNTIYLFWSSYILKFMTTFFRVMSKEPSFHPQKVKSFLLKEYIYIYENCFCALSRPLAALAQ